MAKEVKVVIKLKDELTNGLNKAGSALKKFATRGASFIARLTSKFTKLAKIGIAGAVAGFTALIAKSVQTASSYEALETRLAAVTGSATEAEKRFKEIRKFAAKTPLELEDLVKADILLKSVGKSGQKELEGVASAAATMGRAVEDVARAVVSLETEPLRNLGVQLKKTGEEFEFRFTDQAGNAVVQLATGIEEARKELTGIFSDKFGSGLVAASETVRGKFSTFKDNVKEAFATIGGEMLPTLNKALERATTAIEALIGSGKLEEFGQRIAKAFDFLDRIVRTILENNKKLDAVMKHAGNIFLAVVGDGMSLVLEKMKTSLVNVLKDFASSAASKVFPVVGAVKNVKKLIGRVKTGIQFSGLDEDEKGRSFTSRAVENLEADLLPSSITPRKQKFGDRGVRFSGPTNVVVTNFEDAPSTGLQ